MTDYDDLSISIDVTAAVFDDEPAIARTTTPVERPLPVFDVSDVDEDAPTGRWTKEFDMDGAEQEWGE